MITGISFKLGLETISFDRKLGRNAGITESKRKIYKGEGKTLICLSHTFFSCWIQICQLASVELSVHGIILTLEKI